MISDDPTGRTLEAYLARLLVDPDARARFRSSPAAEARRAGLGDEDCLAVCAIDAGDLELAARSLARKRAASRRPAEVPHARWWHRLGAVLRPGSRRQ